MHVVARWDGKGAQGSEEADIRCMYDCLCIVFSKCLKKVLTLIVLKIISKSSPGWEIPNGNRYVVACWNGKGAQGPGVRRGRYMQLFMPCIYTNMA